MAERDEITPSEATAEGDGRRAAEKAAVEKVEKLYRNKKKPEKTLLRVEKAKNVGVFGKNAPKVT